MEAQLVPEIPEGNWLYEPKWDGFRGVGENARDEVGGDAIATPVAQDVRLLHDPADTADRGAKQDADAHRVVNTVETGVRDRLLSGG
jgi:hypothetical protein